MNELQIFQNPEFGEVRTVEVDGEGWFVGRDVAIALGYAKPENAVPRHVDKEDTLKRGIPSKGGMQQTTLINESGMYALVIMSELPSAKKFKRWITKEVLPSIRKTGSYNLPSLTPNEMILQLAQANVQLEKDVAEIREEVKQLGGKFDNALKTFAAPSIDHWKAEMDAKIKDIIVTYHRSPTGFRGMLYAELEQVANVKINNRLTFHRNRMKKQGATYKERMAVSKIDIISNDKQLRAIFEGIVKKYQAIYGAGDQE